MQSTGFLRLPQVLERIPISRSAWWHGCKEGKFPRPIKLGPKMTVWYESDIVDFINGFAQCKQVVKGENHEI